MTTLAQVTHPADGVAVVAYRNPQIANKTA